jgi:hypothetical protein
MDLIENQYINKNVLRHPWELARYKIIASKINQIIKYSNNDNISIIDIGCGDAYVINKLFYDFKFIDLNAVDINFTENNIQKLSSENSKINYFNDLNMIKLNPNHYYIILLNDVIEHVEDHNNFIKLIKLNIIDKLNSLSFFLTVPAYDNLFSRHDIDLGHYRRYTVKMLMEYNNILELKYKKFGYFFFSLFLARWIECRIEKLQLNSHSNEQIGVSSWKHGKVLTSIIKNMLIFDYTLSSYLNKIRITLPGLSTFIIFTKDEK